MRYFIFESLNNFIIEGVVMVKKKAAKKKATKKKTTRKKAIKKKTTKKKITKKKTINKKTTKNKTIKKKTTKKKVVKRSAADNQKTLYHSLLELIRVTSVEIPDDIQKVILEALEREKKDTSAEYAMNIIKANIELAKKKSQPICQDTGTIHIFVEHPIGYGQSNFTKIVKKAIVYATKKGYLRQNSVDSLTGKNEGMNIGPGHPDLHFIERHNLKSGLKVKLMLKGGGCENVGAQYSLPYNEINAGRDLDGARKVILDAVQKAQGRGCGPGVLGVTIGGDRGTGYKDSKKQLLRPLDDKNTNKDLANLEDEIVVTSNKLGIGPMGFGGKTTLLGCKIGVLNRLPASFFVSVSYMCWAYRRQGVLLGEDHKIKKWLY